MEHASRSNWTEGPVRTGDFADQLNHLAKLIEKLEREISSGVPSREISTGLAATLTGKQVQAIVKARRAREAVFGSELFADPAWDILLEAYAAEVDQRRITVNAICYAAGVPATTAVRWLKKLDRDGWVVRRDHAFDSRRSWVELSTNGSTAMRRYLDSISGLLLPL